MDVDDVERLGERLGFRGERERETPAGLAPWHAGGAHDVGLGVVVVAVAEGEDEHLVARSSKRFLYSEMWLVTPLTCGRYISAKNPMRMRVLA